MVDVSNLNSNENVSCSRFLLWSRQNIVNEYKWMQIHTKGGQYWSSQWNQKPHGALSGRKQFLNSRFTGISSLNLVSRKINNAFHTSRGLFKSRFTENKIPISRFTENKYIHSRFTKLTFTTLYNYSTEILLSRHKLSVNIHPYENCFSCAIYYMTSIRKGEAGPGNTGPGIISSSGKSDRVSQWLFIATTNIHNKICKVYS
jgi:hypothetical protein